MANLDSSVILITGIMASGKSTVAQRLAERLPKSVHLRGDTFRRMIVRGREEMTADYSPEAYRQLLLRYQLARITADAYCEAGFTVVYQDVILGAVLNDVVVELRRLRPTYVVVLCPSPEVVAQREAGRGKTGYGSWTPADLDRSLRNETPQVGLWLDTSALTVEETVDSILARIDDGLR
ncbi:MAG: AAA family ATPase [Anaerolineae bacterium]|nr:AAA family ATPase [Anaerolineae bacterium]